MPALLLLESTCVRDVTSPMDRFVVFEELSEVEFPRGERAEDGVQHARSAVDFVQRRREVVARLLAARDGMGQLLSHPP